MPALAGELAAWFGRWKGPTRTPTASGPDEFNDDAFNDWALRVHAVQRATTPALRRFWREAGCRSPSRWEEIPPVPAAAFRDVAIGPASAETVFRTSGTTRGQSRRGEHRVASLALYRAAARGNYRCHLLRGLKSTRVVSLVPNPGAVPDSSLAAMAGFVCDEPEVSAATWAFDANTGVDVEAVRRAVAAPWPGEPLPHDNGACGRDEGAPRRHARPSHEPVLMLATAFALVQLMDAVEGAGRASAAEGLLLPPGSRVMETGGFKGRTAEVDRESLYRRIRTVLGVPESHVTGEYGMTELLSQAYDAVAGAAGPPAARVQRFPPWVRTRALDPSTLAPQPPGHPGLLAHVDLANAGSASPVLTEDLGATTSDGGFRLLGRATGAAPRGCSLLAESFFRAAAGSTSS